MAPRSSARLDRHVDAADRQHADRAARAVDHAHVRRQQFAHAVARNGVRVAAAELHEAVLAVAAIGFGAQALGDLAGDVAVAEFVDVFHADYSVCGGGFGHLAEQRQRALGLFRVDHADGVADMDDDVVADRCIGHQFDRYFLADAAEVHHCAFVGAQFDQAGGNG
jgi:hypothetical protein